MPSAYAGGHSAAAAWSRHQRKIILRSIDQRKQQLSGAILLFARERTEMLHTRSSSELIGEVYHAAFMGLEGIVSQRRDFPYRPGPADWIKVKCAGWREANAWRHDFFNKEKRK
jgi:ATP-dependent DNA ligase